MRRTAEKNTSAGAGGPEPRHTQNDYNSLWNNSAGLSSEISYDTVPGIPEEVKLQAKLTVITSERPTILAKRLFLDCEGDLKKIAAAEMTEGRAERVSINGLQDMSRLLISLEKNQALVYGTTSHESIGLVTKKAYQQQGKPADRIPRSKDFFLFPKGPAVLMFDYDPEATGNTYDRESLVDALRNVVTGLQDAALLWMPSSSSHIHNNGTEISGLKGQRIYMLVTNGSDIPRAAKAIQEYLWAAGYGYFKVGVAGQLLERCLIDSTVYQPNRLDFAAGAVCKPPLEQKRGEPVLIPGQVEIIDTLEAIPEPPAKVIAQAKANKDNARAAVREQAKEQREKYIAAKAAEIAGTGATDEQIRNAEATVRRALEQDTLHGDFPVIVNEAGKVQAVTVGNILDDPARFHGLKTRDPIEPDYDSGRWVGKLYLFGSRPNLFSFARGGRVFKLMRQPVRVELVRGRTFDVTEQTLALLRTQPDFFDLGDALVLVECGKSYALDENLFKHEIAGRAQYYTSHQTKEGEWVEVLEDPPPKAAKAIIALNERRGLKKLDAAVDMPLIRADGSLLTRPGYDEGSRLLLDIPDSISIPENPTIEECVDALVHLSTPFEEFPIVSETDEAVFLAALFTAVCRPVLDISPAFGIDAPVQGTGKTYLARCLSIIATGEAPAVWPHTSSRDDEEIRKRIFSTLREGSRIVLWDNILGIVSSPSLAAALTSPYYQDRVLGKSESQRVPNKALFLLTGNNICLAGDLPRRVFLMRMDPGMETPYARQFEMDPVAYCMKNRREMVLDVLTIIRGAFLYQDPPADDVGFPEWNGLVRRAVLFVSNHLWPEKFGDPKNAIDEAQSSDPEQEELYALLSAFREHFGSRRVTAKELISANGNLADAIADVMGDRIPTAKGLGRILRFKKDRIVGGLCLKNHAQWEKSAQYWYVIDVKSGE